MNRDHLIARKHAVQQELNEAQRRLEAALNTWDQQAGSSTAELSAASGARSKASSIVDSTDGWLVRIWGCVLRGARGPRAQQARIAQLQQQVDSLMAEEYRLRLAIDQSKR